MLSNHFPTREKAQADMEQHVLNRLDAARELIDIATELKAKENTQ